MRFLGIVALKEGALSSMTDIMNYISYSTKVSELAKIYPIAIFTVKNCLTPQIIEKESTINKQFLNDLHALAS